MKTIIVKLDEQEVTVSKLPLHKYAEVMQALNELPKKVEGLTNASTDEILQKLPALIAGSLPEVVEILAIAVPLDVLAINSLGLDEVVKLAIAVYEVNNYADIMERIKKVARPPATMIPASKGK
jgi:hypothetical protein